MLLVTETFLSYLDGPNNGENHLMEKVKLNYKSVENLWANYLIKNPSNKKSEIPLSFYFCDNQVDADECAELVVKGNKASYCNFFVVV